MINISNGLKVKVCNKDYAWALSHTWSAVLSGTKYYAFRSVGSDQIFMHTEIMKRAKTWKKGKECDHRNGDSLDNSTGNLRSSTRSQNLANRTKFSGYAGNKCTSQFKGVCLDKAAGKYRSQIRVNGKLTYIGNYDTEIEAALNYNLYARKAFGKFALVNVSPEIKNIEAQQAKLIKSLGSSYSKNLKAQLNEVK